MCQSLKKNKYSTVGKSLGIRGNGNTHTFYNSTPPSILFSAARGFGPDLNLNVSDMTE